MMGYQSAKESDFDNDMGCKIMCPTEEIQVLPIVDKDILKDM